MGRGGIASITRRARLNTVTRLTMADRLSLPSLVSLVSLVVVILPRLVCIFSPPIKPRNRSRNEHNSLSLISFPSSRTSEPIRPKD